MKKLQPKSENQRLYLEIIEKNDVILCEGLSGTGKSFCAIWYALDKLLNGKIEQLVIAKPLLEAEKEIGAMPGDLKEKTQYYFGSLVETIKCFVDTKEFDSLIKNKKIRFLPISFWRGHTFNNSIIIIDESQNLLINQFKLAITRIGYKSKTIFCGDCSQTDLKSTKPIYSKCIEELKTIHGVGTISFTEKDIVRHDIIAKILIKLGNIAIE